MRYEQVIRSLPRVLIGAAIIDFTRRCLMLVFYFEGLQQWGSAHPNQNIYSMVLDVVFERAVNLFIYPLGWLASAATIYLLIAILDKGRASNA